MRGERSRGSEKYGRDGNGKRVCVDGCKAVQGGEGMGFVELLVVCFISGMLVGVLDAVMF